MGGTIYYLNIIIGYGNITCECYGEIISLDLKSDPEFDSKLANKQILGQYY